MTGILGQQLSLMESLRAATFKAHAEMQTAPFFEAMAACRLPLESYVGYLRALMLVHEALEASLAKSADPQVAMVWSHDMRRVPRLREDLRYFEPRAVADLKEAAAAALAIDTEVRLRSLERPLSLLGGLYVLEGSMLGARAIKPLAARAFLLQGDDGLSYLEGDGAAVRARWSRFQERMNALQLADVERADIVEAARDLFRGMEAVCRALYPFSPDSKRLLATSINPEAGRHAVPDDEREVQAALRAADICWARYPYYEHRYGERGRRFARSDAAWQATLHRYEPAQILQQVRWLGRVLAARGMPTFLLEAQLEILVEEMTAALPENKEAYEKLRPAADDLRASRRLHLSDEEVARLAAGFDRAAGPGWTGRLPRTGALLACAVADERQGCDGAVSSLESWLTDASRFPAAWRAAVEETIAEARQLASGHRG